MNLGFESQVPRRYAGMPQSIADPLDHFGAKEFYLCGKHDALESISAYATQAPFHTEVCRRRFKLRRMERTPDDRRDILRRFINDNRLKIARWAKMAGVDKNSIYNFLNGHSQALDLKTYAKLARAAEVPMWQLSGDAPEAPSPTSLWVVGQVEAGEYTEAVEWDTSRWYPVDVPVPDRFKGMAKALEARGPSMNLEYPEGSIIVWVDLLDSRPAREGDHLIIYAYAKDDGIEATVKELRVVDDKAWLWPRSNHPAHQMPIDPANPPEHIERIEIKGLVLGGYRPRIF